MWGKRLDGDLGEKAGIWEIKKLGEGYELKFWKERRGRVKKSGIKFWKRRRDRVKKSGIRVRCFLNRKRGKGRVKLEKERE